MRKFPGNMSALISAVVAIAVNGPLPHNSAIAGDDGRSAIVLTAKERNAILLEMRGFLESVQAITTGLANEDNQAIAASARKSGMAAAKDVPQALKDKLPLEFKKLGMATHQAFDALSREAQDIGERQVMLTQLGDLMRNCTACHAAYRIEDESWKSR